MLYIRGAAYLSARMGTGAPSEFEKILKNRGLGVNLPYYPLAHLGLARAYALDGNKAASWREYEGFLRCGRMLTKIFPSFEKPEATTPN